MPQAAQPRIANRRTGISEVPAERRGVSSTAMESNGSATFRVALYRAMGFYIARVQELPGCICRGATEVEAVEMARASIRAYLQVTRAIEGDRATVHVQIKV